MSEEFNSKNVSDDNNGTNLTKEEAKLFYEAAVTGLLRVKQDLEKKESPKSWYWRLFESGAGAALITVLIGGIFGTIITAVIQYQAKQREFEQTFIKTRHDQALISFRTFSEKREEFIRNTLKVIGETINTADDYALYFKSKDIPLANDPTDIIKKKTDIHDALFSKYKSSKDNWRKEQNIISDSVLYYFPEKTEPAQNFQKFHSAMENYIVCVDSVQEHQQDACDKEKSNVEAKLFELMKSFVISREYEWRELTDPQKTKEFLKQISDVR